MKLFFTTLILLTQAYSVYSQDTIANKKTITYKRLKDSNIFQKVKLNFQENYIKLSTTSNFDFSKNDKLLENGITNLEKSTLKKISSEYDNIIDTLEYRPNNIKIGESNFKRTEIMLFLNNLIDVHAKLTNNPWVMEGGIKLQNFDRSNIIDLTASSDYKSSGLEKNLEMFIEANYNMLNNSVNQKYIKLGGQFKQAIFKRDEDKFRLDWYTQLNQTSVASLNIRRRLILGGGLLFDIYYSGNHYKKGSKKNNRRLNHNEKKKVDQLYEVLSKLNPSLSNDENYLVFCINKLGTCKLIEMTSKEKEEFSTLTNDLLKAYKKTSSMFKVNWKIGLNHESTNTKRPIKLYFSDSLREHKFNVNRMFRLETGPIININYDKFSLEASSLAHIKVLNNPEDIVINALDTNQISNLTDYWLDFNFELGFKLNKTTKITANYNLIKLNSPKRGFYNINANVPDSDPDFKLFIADSKFTNFNLGLKISLN